LVVAARIATDFALDLQFSMHMLDYELDCPMTILADNNAIVLNTIIPSSQIKKEQVVCAYHHV
jgi:hypothetical protein